jgi:hypothetical protein
MNLARLVAALPLLAVLSVPAFSAADEASVGGQKFGFKPFGAKKN